MRISDWSSDVCSSDLAILLQPDMELVGVADIATDWRIKSVTNRLPLFASTEDAKVAMIAAGLRPLGTLDELLEFSDIIIDTTPKHVEAGNLGDRKSTRLNSRHTCASRIPHSSCKKRPRHNQ